MTLSSSSLRIKSNGSLHVGAFCALFIVFLGLLGPSLRGQSFRDGFNPAISGTVFATAVQPDGKILIGGAFTSVNAQLKTNLARLNADGTLDNSFAATYPNGTVYALMVRSDGKILVGGGFTSLSGKNYLQRLNSDGSVDSTFLSPALDNYVFALTPQADGKLLVGGGFQKVGSASYLGLVRLNTDGSLDPSLANPGFNGDVKTIAVQADGKIFTGGYFTKVGVGLAADGSVISGTGATYNYLCRLNSNGSLDSGFANANLDNFVNVVTIQSDGKLLVGGNFSMAGITSYNALIRLTTTGAIDSTFPNPLINSNVYALAVQPDGQIIIGGAFSNVNAIGASYGHLARLNSDGTYDQNFSNPSLISSVFSIILQPGSRVIAAFSSSTTIGNTVNNYLARFAADGTIDTTFINSNLTGNVASLAVQPDGKLIVGSGGAGSGFITRFAPDGTSDPVFVNPVFNGLVDTVAVQADGKILAGGTFTLVNGIARSRLARLNADGSLDNSFTPSFGSDVYAIAIQSSGKILVSGAFTTVNSVSKNRLVRLNIDGSIDGSFFNPNLNNDVYVVVIQGDGKILLGGAFTSVAGQSGNYMTRLLVDGTVDGAYNPNFNDKVFAISLQNDGKPVVGGQFTFAGSGTYGYMARVNVDGTIDTAFADPAFQGPVFALAAQPGGRIYVGGSFTSVNVTTTTTSTTTTTGTTTSTSSSGIGYSYLAQINTDGSVDNTFVSPGFNSNVDAIVIQPDTKVAIGGIFTSAGGVGVSANHLVRINPDTTFDIPLTNPRVGASVVAIASGPDTKPVLGGSFTTVGIGSTEFDCAVRLSLSGQIDGSMANAAFNHDVAAVAVQPDGSIVFGGAFNNVQSSTYSCVVRLTTNALLDNTFVDPKIGGGTSPRVNALAVSLAGQILAGGSFSTAGSSNAAYGNLVRINADGSIDGSFINPKIDAAVSSIIIQPSDSKTIVGGSFSNISGQPRSGVGRLNFDGSLDVGFVNPAINGSVAALGLQSDGKILIAGNFSLVGGLARTSIARLNSNGAVDPSFPNISINGSVATLALQSNGKILIGGSFTSVGGLTYGHSARLNSDGSVDTTFTDLGLNDNVLATSLEFDGKVFVGGNFTTVGNSSAQYGRFFRVSNNDAASQVIIGNSDGTLVTWTPSGSLMVPTMVTFEYSTDGTTWNLLGNASRGNGSTWQLGGLSLNPGTANYIRVSAAGPSNGSGSQSSLQYTKLVYPKAPGTL